MNEESIVEHRRTSVCHESVRTISFSSPSTSVPTSTISSPLNSEASTSALNPESPSTDDYDFDPIDEHSRKNYSGINVRSLPSYSEAVSGHSDYDRNSQALSFEESPLKSNYFNNSDDQNSLNSKPDLESQRDIDSSPAQELDSNNEPSKQKLGYRKVQDGVVTYKNIESAQIMGSIQIGIQHSIGSLASKPERDVLFNDFNHVDTVSFPRAGTTTTPGHIYDDFTFTTYTPNAFRHFRDLFGIRPEDFMISMCTQPLTELSNPGASGSMFFRTHDDRFILKTVEKNECTFLLKLLAGYYLNLSQNPDTLLPKFYGVYTYECSGRNIRLIVMNNLLPSNVKIHQKYDLKGSTFNRKASKEECKKSSPTYKDLDFLEHHNLTGIYKTKSQANLNKNNSISSKVIANDDDTTGRGLFLAPNTYDMLIDILNRDCRVLESFAIMDYSLLVAVHNYDKRLEEIQSEDIPDSRYVNFSYDDDDQLPLGGIRATNAKGERLLLFVGVIDILQSYRLAKKLEHAWKSVLYDGKTVSVVKPKFYSARFLEFMTKIVFGREPDKEATIDKRPHYYRYAENLKTGSLQRMRKFGSMLR